MSRIIKLRWPAVCKDCGADLPEGTEARYYGRGKVYGVHCHDKDGNCTPWGPSGPGETTAEDWNGVRDPAEDAADRDQEAGALDRIAGGRA